MASKFAVKVSIGDVLVIQGQNFTVEYITIDYVRFVGKDEQGRELRANRETLADHLLSGEVTFADGRAIESALPARYVL